MNGEKFGLKSDTTEKISSIFKKHPSIERALVYGSRAKGNFKEGSDIDLTLIGEQLTATELLRISDEIEELGLPYKLDLSIHSKIEDPALLDHIQRIGKEFYRR